VKLATGWHKGDTTVKGNVPNIRSNVGPFSFPLTTPMDGTVNTAEQLKSMRKVYSNATPD